MPINPTISRSLLSEQRYGFGLAFFKCEIGNAAKDFTPEINQIKGMGTVATTARDREFIEKGNNCSFVRTRLNLLS